MHPLHVDPDRDGRLQTGIYVRAFRNRVVGDADIADLDTRSLLNWLKAQGPSVTERTVLVLLGHDLTRG